MARKLSREEEQAFYKLHSCKGVIVSPRMDYTSGFTRFVTIPSVERQSSDLRDSSGDHSLTNDDLGWVK